METSAKLKSVRKSCNVLEIVFKVIKIMMIVAAGICLVTSLLVAIFGKNMLQFDGVINNKNVNFSLHLFDDNALSIHDGKVDGFLTPIFEKALEGAKWNDEDIHDIKSLEEALKGDIDIEDMAVANFAARWIIAGSIFAAAVLTAAAAVIFWLIEKIFKDIKESESPFTEAIIKKLRIVFIIISVCALIFYGIANGLIAALLCWALYCIIDYGYALQLEVDETL
ncbi:MAG: hypothetical protein IJM91_01365 [Lachnospiraceae bacterium]|nr:hypothetical protein [Lachnospiraceae bacterium]